MLSHFLFHFVHNPRQQRLLSFLASTIKIEESVPALYPISIKEAGSFLVSSVQSLTKLQQQLIQSKNLHLCHSYRYLFLIDSVTDGLLI
jgi:hypothetical protein